MCEALLRKVGDQPDDGHGQLRLAERPPLLVERLRQDDTQVVPLLPGDVRRRPNPAVGVDQPEHEHLPHGGLRGGVVPQQLDTVQERVLEDEHTAGWSVNGAELDMVGHLFALVGDLPQRTGADALPRQAEPRPDEARWHCGFVFLPVFLLAFLLVFFLVFFLVGLLHALLLLLLRLRGVSAGLALPAPVVGEDRDAGASEAVSDDLCRYLAPPGDVAIPQTAERQTPAARAGAHAVVDDACGHDALVAHALHVPAPSVALPRLQLVVCRLDDHLQPAAPQAHDVARPGGRDHALEEGQHPREGLLQGGQQLWILGCVVQVGGHPGAPVHVDVDLRRQPLVAGPLVHSNPAVPKAVGLRGLPTRSWQLAVLPARVRRDQRLEVRRAALAVDVGIKRGMDEVPDRLPRPGVEVLADCRDAVQALRQLGQKLTGNETVLVRDAAQLVVVVARQLAHRAGEGILGRSLLDGLPAPLLEELGGAELPAPVPLRRDGRLDLQDDVVDAPLRLVPCSRTGWLLGHRAKVLVWLAHQTPPARLLGSGFPLVCACAHHGGAVGCALGSQSGRTLRKMA
mmetsp:Transcript_64134/g.191118  ORF Transcript_64134/g.191118 Transcript_64134/m.191118 type:complete len:570 (-) Transcript_64134:3-1712(-)